MNRLLNAPVTRLFTRTSCPPFRWTAAFLGFFLLCQSASSQTEWKDITYAIPGSQDWGLLSPTNQVLKVMDKGLDLPEGYLAQGTNYEYKVVAIGMDGRPRHESNIAEATPRKVVVLVRGYGDDDPDYWQRMKDSLTENEFEVLDPTDTWISGQSNVWDNADLLREYIDTYLQVLESEGRSPPYSISIIAHSMGGLITRAYLATGTQIPVDCVIMLSPINSGSWLGNWLMRQTWPVREIAGPFRDPSWPSSRHSTVDFALTFNEEVPDLHYKNPDTRFFTIGGTRTGLNPIFFDSSLLIAAEMRRNHPDLFPWSAFFVVTDGVVTRESSFGEVSRPAAHLYDSLRDEQEVIGACTVRGFEDKIPMPYNHDFIKSAPAVLDLCHDILLDEYVGTQHSALAGDAVSTEDEFPATNGWQLVTEYGGALTVSSSTNQSVSVNDSVQTAFTISWSTGTVDFAVIDPDGKRIGPSEASTNSQVSFQATNNAAYYLIETPIVGEWSIEITHSGGITNDIGYTGRAFLDSALSLTVTRGAARHARGSAVPLLGTIADNGVSVTNATVDGSVRFPDGTWHPIALLDDGIHGDSVQDDGIYGLVFTNTSHLGMYGINIGATGVDSNEDAFERVGMGQITFTIFEPTATFTNAYDDYGIDLPSTNGLIDHLVIEVGVVAVTAGTFTIAGTLADTNGAEITSANTSITVAQSGMTTALLQFASGPIYDSRATGGFDLVDLVLLGTGDNYAPLDSRSNAYATAGYDWDWFEPTDTDGDGLSNLDERDNFITDPEHEDSDLDGMNDYAEVAYDGNALEYSAGNDTDPNDPDTDGDILSDGWEVANGFDPLVADSAGDGDGDGLSNTNEFFYHSNPQVRDTDGEGLEDGPEVNLYGTLPTLADTDGDGLTDYEEIYHDGDGGYNPYNPTSNPTGTDTDATNADSDGDGIPDGWESNNSQDPLYDDAGLDPDQDGLTNLQEWQYRTDPNNPDTDGDGASDGWEITYLLHPKGDYDGVMDYDGDGHMNWQEFISGTDPTNVLSVFSINTIATPAASNLVLSWPSVSNRLYSLSFRTNLATGEWSLVFSNTLATPPTNTVTVDVESAVQRFYRIGVEQAE